MSALSMKYNFSFANQTNLDISLLNSTEILFNEADHPVSADSKY